MSLVVGSEWFNAPVDMMAVRRDVQGSLTMNGHDHRPVPDDGKGKDAHLAQRLSYRPPLSLFCRSATIYRCGCLYCLASRQKTTPGLEKTSRLIVGCDVGCVVEKPRPYCVL